MSLTHTCLYLRQSPPAKKGKATPTKKGGKGGANAEANEPPPGTLESLLANTMFSNLNYLCIFLKIA